MTILKFIWEFLKKLWKAILDYFNPHKKPIVRITILTVFLFSLISLCNAQRTGISGFTVIFNQPNIVNIDYWRIVWHDGISDSMDIYKTDETRVRLKYSDGNWYQYNQLPGILDTLLVNIKIKKFINFNEVFKFSVYSFNDTISSEANTIDVLFMSCDINKTNNKNIERGYYIGDNVVDGLDLIELSKNWGKTGVGLTDYYDITGDGNVDGLDLIELSKNWGKTWFP